MCRLPRTVATLALFLSLALTGCGNRVAQRVGAEDDTRRVENDLKAIHLMYLAYETANKKPPEKADDLAAIQDQDKQLYGDAFERLKKGDYVVRWKTPQDEATRSRLAREVLAYAAAPAVDGTHVVLMGDGTLQRVDAAKFASMKKEEPLTALRTWRTTGSGRSGPAPPRRPSRSACRPAAGGSRAVGRG